MQNLIPHVNAAASQLWLQLQALAQAALVPWRLWQLAAIAGLLIIAVLLRRRLSPRLRAWLRRREGWSKGRLRLGLLVDRKLRAILFAALAWSAVLIMRQIAEPPRSQLIALAASIVTAWVAIEFGVRVIGNRLLRHIVRWVAWGWATLYFLNLLDAASRILDSLALQIGTFRLSVLMVLKAVVVVAVMTALARGAARLIDASVARNPDLSPSMRALTTQVVNMAAFALAVVVGLSIVGIDMTGLTVFSGAVGVGLGFGLQKVVSNLVSGVIILLDKSVKPGDVISLGQTFGWIDQIGARYTSVITRDGKEYLIPNEDMVTNQVVNWSHKDELVRIDLNFIASYDADPHQVTRVAIESASAVRRVLSNRPPVCWITEFGQNAVHYVLRFWITDAAGGLTNVRGQVFLALWDAFKENGIAVPLPQREIRIVNTPLPPPRDTTGEDGSDGAGAAADLAQRVQGTAGPRAAQGPAAG